jgi:hypothetical protein
VFAGSSFYPSLNNRGDLAFAGIVPTDQGIHLPDEPYVGLGVGIYQADKAGHLFSVAIPGDTAPGGGKFDFAIEPSINDGGDIAFGGHVAGEEAHVPGFPPQAALIGALGSLYVKVGATGKILSIAHAGDAAPGGGVFRQASFGQINNRGDVLFTGDLTPAPDANQVLGVFLDSGGVIIPIARPGDPMPGGGHLVTASVVGGNTHLNNQGDVVFDGVLDTDVDGDGTLDTGLFQWSQGRVSLIARTGTVLPEVGTIHNLVMGVIVTPPPPVLVPNTGVVNNDRGQVLFGATLTDGRQVLLLDTPAGSFPGAADVVADPSLLGSASSSARVEAAPTVTQRTACVPAAQEAGMRPLASQALIGSAGSPHIRALDRIFVNLEDFMLDDGLQDDLAPRNA